MLAIVTKRPHSLEREMHFKQNRNCCEGVLCGDSDDLGDLYPSLHLPVETDVEAVTQGLRGVAGGRGQ